MGGKLKKVFFFAGRLLRNLILVLIFCEFVVYYCVIAQCNWAKLKQESIEDGLKTMILADTHMLGPFRGHPFDKLRREWQMRRSFQTAMQLFSPDVVFILGDVFDEGNWVDDRGFQEYVARFHSIFSVSNSTRLYALHGNHDISFHYQMHPHLVRRFNKAFNTIGVRLIREKKWTRAGKERAVNFVFINSMAMEGDGCSLCNEAEFNVKLIGDRLNKSKSRPSYSQPVVLQHFPTFRTSDKDCREKSPVTETYREKWDTLSKDSTEFLVNQLDPRVFFSGHSHHFCSLKNSFDIDEFTVASFNWRNLNNPSFLLAIFTPHDYSVSKCELPKETSVFILYFVGVVLSIVFALRINFRKIWRKEKSKMNKVRKD